MARGTADGQGEVSEACTGKDGDLVAGASRSCGVHWHSGSARGPDRRLVLFCLSRSAERADVLGALS